MSIIFVYTITSLLFFYAGMWIGIHLAWKKIGTAFKNNKELSKYLNEHKL